MIEKYFGGKLPADRVESEFDADLKAMAASVIPVVEDKMDNLTQTFADRVCFNQPWNIDEGKDFAYSIYRIHNWGEIINVIQNIERKEKEWEK